MKKQAKKTNLWWNCGSLEEGQVQVKEWDDTRISKRVGKTSLKDKYTYLKRQAKELNYTESWKVVSSSRLKKHARKTILWWNCLSAMQVQNHICRALSKTYRRNKQGKLIYGEIVALSLWQPGRCKKSSEVISRCEGDQPGVSCLLSTDILQIEFRTSVTTEYFRNW